MSQKTWGGRFAAATDRVEEFTESISFDRRLYRARHPRQPGPRPHARRRRPAHRRPRPSRSPPPSTTSPAEIERGEIHVLASRSKTSTRTSSGALIERLGDVGRKLHTGRSRNDQVVTDVKLWVRDAIDGIDGRLLDLQRRLRRRRPSGERDVDPARLHAPAAGPAGAGGALLPGLRREVPARPRPAGRLPQARQRPAAGRRGPGRHVAADRPRAACARQLGFDARRAPTASTSSSDRDFAARVRLRPVADRRCT